ncbi:hypothetical protein BDZ85DRAFT_294096 [Elsinoe ampelina]|uniref:Uncharacterized protein n=1 Tax=Elsinoe ampelina TaxID=302913 RepID=A0A6A6GJM2_9PEZI|nr:hypothetical protein BDZ85DRAFT_294096 [Elsinoe ampelina]
MILALQRLRAVRSCRPRCAHFHTWSSKSLTSSFSPAVRKASTAITIDKDQTENKRSIDGVNSNRKPRSITDILKEDLDDRHAKNLRRELRYLQDPAKLDESVRRHLTKNDFSKALNLLRLSSPYMKCIVGWNAIVEYLAQRREYDAAFKIYNEMKKRGQFPDAITVTLFMRGLAEKPVSKQQVTLADRIYDSLAADNSKVKRSIIHTNAVLQVYLNAGDMDAVWKVVSELPEEGPGAMDRISFTTLFRGFRERILEVSDGEPDRDAKIQQYVSDEQQLWHLAIDKWRKGRLRIDSQLIGSHLQMLLVRPSAGSALDVLRCVEETMGITVNDQTPAVESNSKKADTAHKCKPVPAHAVILSSVLTACTNLLEKPAQGIRSARSYWKLFIETSGVLPDNDNYKTYLRHAIKAFDSTQAAEAIQQLKDDTKSARQDQRLQANPSMYTLAMTACAAASADDSHVRDGQRSRRPAASRNEHKVKDTAKRKSVEDGLVPLRDADRILDALKGDLTMYDPRTFRKYLSCAVSSHSPSHIFDALKKLQPFVEALMYQVEVASTAREASKSHRAVYRSSEKQAEANLLVNFYATIADLLASKEGVRIIEEDGRSMLELERLFTLSQRWLDKIERNKGSRDEVESRRVKVPFGKRSVTDRVFHRIVKAASAGAGDDGRELYRFLRAWGMPSRLLKGRMRAIQAPRSDLDIQDLATVPSSQEPWWDGDELMKYQYAVLCTMTKAESHNAFKDTRIRQTLRDLTVWRDECGKWLETRTISTEALQPERLQVYAQKMQGYKDTAARGVDPIEGRGLRRIDHRAWTQLSILVDSIGGFTSTQDIHA